LRGALDALSSWPDAVREAVAGWLTPPPSPSEFGPETLAVRTSSHGGTGCGGRPFLDDLKRLGFCDVEIVLNDDVSAASLASTGTDSMLSTVLEGNGADRDAPPPQPPPADASRATLTPPRRRAFVKPTAAEVREAKQALLAAMKAHPAAGTHELARLTGSRPPTVAERLRRLEGRGLIARDAGGKRRAVEARPT